MRIFHETIAPQTDAELRECALTYLNDRYAAAFDIVERDEWLRIDRIGMRLLRAEGLLPVEWAYLKMAVTGMGDASVKYVMNRRGAGLHLRPAHGAAPLFPPRALPAFGRREPGHQGAHRVVFRGALLVRKDGPACRRNAAL